MRIWMMAPLGLALVLTAACGETRGQKATTGALGGGAAGAVVGGPVGALVGAGAGAAGGAYREGLQDRADEAVDRGAQRVEGAVDQTLQPDQPGTAQTAQAPRMDEPQFGAAAGAQQAAGPTNEEVRNAQTALQQMGLYEGQVDGLYGRRTIAAVHEFQSQQDLPRTGMLDNQTMQHLQTAMAEGPAATPPTGAQQADRPQPGQAGGMERPMQPPEQPQMGPGGAPGDAQPGGVAPGGPAMQPDSPQTQPVPPAQPR